MPKTSGKFIWIITIAVLIAIALILGGTWGYPRYLLHKARADLFSNEPKLMGPAFAYLLGRGDAGLKTLEDFCRENTDPGWGEEIEGVKLRVNAKYLVFGNNPGKKKTASIFRMEMKNVSDNAAELRVWANAGRNLHCDWQFIIEPNGKIYYRIHLLRTALRTAGGMIREKTLKPGEVDIIQFSKDENIPGNFMPGLYYKVKFMYSRLESNEFTFVVLPD
ncbi:MAG: hypothetical protein E3J72_21030 [Planctomycetota bacterium]|nr:MAG: hypothetical protein E3J72_21030 [Planctomycetota bacterium]